MFNVLTFGTQMSGKMTFGIQLLGRMTFNIPVLGEMTFGSELSEVMTFGNLNVWSDDIRCSSIRRDDIPKSHV